MSWNQVLMDGLLGALISSLFTVAVAIYAIRLTQRVDRTARREDLSLAAAKDLTVVLQDIGRRLDHLSDHTVPASRTTRSAAYRALATDLRMATNLHAPVLSPPSLAELPVTMRSVLDAFVKAVQRREEAVMREERLTDRTEDDEYAVDRRATQLRDQLTDYLNAVTDALTVYRQGGVSELPPEPPFAASRV